MNYSAVRWLFTLSLLLQCACGWQLRGANAGVGAAAELPTSLHLQTLTHNSKMTQEIQNILRSREIAQDLNAPLTLVLEEESLDKRPLSVTDTGVTAQYQLTLTVRYHYLQQAPDHKPVQHPAHKVVSWRSYDFDAKLIVAKNQEEQSLLQEMREELAYRILADFPQ